MTTNQLICEQIHNLIGLSKSSKKLLLQALNDRELSRQNENFIVFYRYVFPKFSNIEKARELLQKHAGNIESNIRKLEKELSTLRKFLSAPNMLVESEWTNPERSLQVHQLYRFGETSKPRISDYNPAQLGLRYLAQKQIACVIKFVEHQPKLIEASEQAYLWDPFTFVKSMFGKPFQKASKTINWLEIPKELSSRQDLAHIVHCTHSIKSKSVHDCIRRSSQFLLTYERDENQNYSLKNTQQIRNKRLVQLKKEIK